MRSRFTALGDLVKAGLQRTGLQGVVKEQAAIAMWDEVVGEKTASVTRPERIREGILYVTCRDSMWAQQLHFLRPMIIKKINERLRGTVIKEIRLSGVGFKDEPRQGKPKPEAVPTLTDDEKSVADRAVGVIEDPDLARKVARALRASKTLQKREMKRRE